MRGRKCAAVPVYPPRIESGSWRKTFVTSAKGQKRTLLFPPINGHFKVHSCIAYSRDNIGRDNQIFGHERIGKDHSHVHAGASDLALRYQTWNDVADRPDKFEQSSPLICVISVIDLSIRPVR